MARILYHDCAVCGRHTSYTLYRSQTSDYICRWCAHERDVKAGKRFPTQLPNPYDD